MIVIAKDAEDRLYEELRLCREKNPGQRCFYAAFSRAEVSGKELFSNFLNLLQEVPDSYKAQVYICRDRDVFILMQGFMQRHFSAFLERLGESIGMANMSELADVMEVGMHWRKLESLCTRKIEFVRRQEEQKNEETGEEKNKKTRTDVLSTLSPESVTTLDNRRRSRVSPLIMVVDDDQICRTLAGNVIRELYNCICVKDGVSALKEYVDAAPDVLFLDIGLPDINGHDLLESLFQIDPKAYIIMFSGRKDKQNIMRALEAGSQGFIGKPFTREKLFHYIKRSPHLLDKQSQGEKHANTAK